MNNPYNAFRQITGLLIQTILADYLKTFAIIVFVLSALGYATPEVNAQTIVLQEVVMGKAAVSSPTSVKMTAGFHAINGSAFRAFIGAIQGTSAAFTVTVPSSSAVPPSGTQSNNFVKTITYLEAEPNVPTTAFKHLEEISYIDGLGRPLQNVTVGAAPNGEDIIQPILYDALGREAIKTLPYTEARTGNFRTSVTEATVNNYYFTDAKVPEGVEKNNRAFTSIAFENSPLNRVVTQTGPGTAWASRPVTINYLSNTTEVQGWKITSTGTFTSFNYLVYNLYVTETIDEQGNATREYKDKKGKVIQKSSLLNGIWLRTAYIYDDLDLLRCVVPPKATDPNTNTTLCYYYKYDERKRMTEKKIPGGGTIKMVYDVRDRLRCTQDSKQAPNEWTFTKYDELNRPVITGILSNYTGGAENLENVINATNLNETRENSVTYYGYNRASFPGSAEQTEVLTVTFYDDYTFRNPLGLEPGHLSATYGDPYLFNSKIDIDPKGQVTGSMIKVLSPSDGYSVSDVLLYTVNYYDKYGHLLRSISENHLGGKDIVSNKYEDITYLVTKSKQQHYMGGAEVLWIEKTMDYDHTGRLLSTIEQVKDQTAFTLNAMKYNKAGQLVTKYLHSGQTTGSRTFSQKVDYQYNIRGWLTKINDPALTGDNDLFGMLLCYETTAGMDGLNNSTGFFNGNIVGMKWNIKNDKLRGYRFTYDNLNRLLTAYYADSTSLGFRNDYFTEKITEYDANGNIKKLQRKYNYATVDNLTYEYVNSNVSNQLLKITDAGTAHNAFDDYPGTSGNYAYDANGNMITDGSRGAGFTYHKVINLPSTVDFGYDRIYYHYNAGGAKLIKNVKHNNNPVSITHYIGNIVYVGDTLKYIVTEEGRLVAVYTGADRRFVPEYNLKDHLGNNRVTFMGSNLGGGNVDMVQTTSYYPFGLILSQKNSNTANGYSKNKYLYNGKEIQDDRFDGTFFGMLDYGARMYDPQIGRFTCLDPIADQFPHVTPYNYAENKVINCIDLWGLQAVMVTAGARGALPMFGPFGVSASFEMGLIYDFEGNLVLVSNVAFGVSIGAAISIGINGTYYHTANTYEDLLGLGVDAGLSSTFPINLQGNLTLPGDGPNKGGISITGRATAGLAAYADVTFTNLVSDFGNINNATASVINKISRTLGISKQQARIIIKLMKAKLEEEEEKKWAQIGTLIPAATITAEDPRKKLQKQIEDMMWQSVEPNVYGNTGRYNKPGRTCDPYYSDYFLKWYYAPSEKDKK